MTFGNNYDSEQKILSTYTCESKLKLRGARCIYIKKARREGGISISSSYTVNSQEITSIVD